MKRVEPPSETPSIRQIPIVNRQQNRQKMRGSTQHGLSKTLKIKIYYFFNPTKFLFQIIIHILIRLSLSNYISFNQ